MADQEESMKVKRTISGGAIYDLIERGALLALALSTIVRLAPRLIETPSIGLILASEGLAMAFVLFRRPAEQIDRSFYATTITVLGTAAPLLIIAPGHGLIPANLAAGIMIVGLLFSISAKLALNRSFGLTAANRGVKRAGPYRYVRHPMYAGYVATQVAFLLMNPCAWNLAVYAIGWAAQILRIQAEEKVLLEDAAYRTYAGEVRFRLAPGLY
jgi:protein-S-isoprenylcysteine O-methyltransferase Ste14